MNRSKPLESWKCNVDGYQAVMLVGSMLSALGAVLWLYVAVVTYRGQVNAQIFLDCNERYESILSSFPKEAWQARLNIKNALPDPSIELTLCALRFLNLSSEEYYLYK